MSQIAYSKELGGKSIAPPNIVLIMADDLGYGDLGCYGSERISTPHLDQLAAGGVRFRDFHSSGAVCSPTRAGLLTGRYQQRAGIPGVIVAALDGATHSHGLHDREVTLAEVFRDAGYATAVFGKWHLGYYPAYNPVRHGFDQFRGYVSGNVDFFSHVDQAGQLDWWRNDELRDEPGYTTHLITSHSLEFIDQHADRPFCLYLAYEPPHYPYQGPGDGPVRKVGQGRGPAELSQSAAEIQRAYREMVEAMDVGIGQIVARLAKRDLTRRTLIFFCSDNGATARGSTGGLRGHKGQLWEGGHRVPGIANWPGRIAAGRVTDELAISLDIMPTLLEAAGIARPQTRGLDGISLWPHLTTGQVVAPRKLFWGHGQARAMRDGPWKLVKGERGQRNPALFRLDQDLAERADLAAEQPQRVRSMLADLGAWERQVAENATTQPAMPPAPGN